MSYYHTCRVKYEKEGQTATYREAYQVDQVSIETFGSCEEFHKFHQDEANDSLLLIVSVQCLLHTQSMHVIRNFITYTMRNKKKKTNTNTYQGKEKEMTEVETASWIMLTAAKHKTTVGMGYL